MASEGADLSGWQLQVARAASYDGLTIAGLGINPEFKQQPWVARLDPGTFVPEPSSEVLGVIALLIVTFLAYSTRKRRGEGKWISQMHIRPTKRVLLVIAIVAACRCQAAEVLYAQQIDADVKEFKARWRLQLLPDELPDFRTKIKNTSWIERGLPSRSGRGAISWIVFPETDKDVVQSIEFIWKGYDRRKQQPPVEVTDEKHSLLLLGPFFEFDKRVRTFAIDDDGKTLAIDAAVNVGDRQWYNLEVWGRNASSGEFIYLVRERLIEFKVDPWTTNTGVVNEFVHHHSSNGVDNDTYQISGRFDRPEQYVPKDYYEVKMKGKLLDGRHQTSRILCWWWERITPLSRPTGQTSAREYSERIYNDHTGRTSRLPPRSGYGSDYYGE